MSNLIRIIISLSLSGTIIAILVWVLCLILKNRLSKTWQYYIWLVVILRLLIPINLGNEFAQLADKIIVSPIISDFAVQQTITAKQQTNLDTTGSNMTATIDNQFFYRLKSMAAFLSSAQILTYLGNLWVIIAVLLLTKKIISYQVYIRFVIKNSKQIHLQSITDIYSQICKNAGLQKNIPLYSFKKIQSPMLVGLINPRIILPETMIDTYNGWQYIFIHELIHYKRLDFFYKWLVQLTVCVHFFNPIVYFLRSFINKSCELSCDEMVIKKLDENGKKAYGMAIINALEAGNGYVQTPISFQFYSVNSIKERLGAIMKYKKGSKTKSVLTAFLTVAICIGTAFTNIYKSEAFAQPSITADPPATMETTENKEFQIDVNIAQTNGNVFVEKIGKHYFLKDDTIVTNLNWKGDSNVMFLYTLEEFSTDDIVSLVNKGIIPLNADNKTFNNGTNNTSQLSSNFTYTLVDRELKLNFVTSSNKPIYWQNKVPSSGDYNMYIITPGDKGISDIQGNITIQTLNVSEKLPHMNMWSGSPNEVPKDNGIEINPINYVGDKIIYDFNIDENNISKNAELYSSIIGEYEIVFVDNERTILRTIPSFSGSKKIILSDLPKGKIHVIVKANNISGYLSLTMTDSKS